MSCAGYSSLRAVRVSREVLSWRAASGRAHDGCTGTYLARTRDVARHRRGRATSRAPSARFSSALFHSPAIPRERSTH